MTAGPDFVAVGHVTLDQFDGERRPGGAAYYAAVTAHRLGLRVGLLTSHGPDFPEDALPDGLSVVKVDARHTTTFAHARAAASGRTLRMTGRAADLEVEDLPAPWREVPLALLCPVAGEVDPLLAACFPDGSLGVLPQGWMRERGAGGAIAPRAWEDAALVLPHAQVLVVSEEDVAPFREEALEWFQQVPVGAVTRGALGATLFVNGEAYTVAPDSAVERDVTGAGDVFATALLVEYHRGADPWEAAAAAACAAAAAVEGTGAAAVPDRVALAARLAAYRARLAG
ncbi:MAG: ribokinase [Candidatus Rokubacteria bacterium]|nr:ribokinase [Candidatus Rokubacteria bacterium]MBI3106842.1 ribokinase [Candidatus Rokubacteria bacterium]